ncbi:hypothetical protein AMTRI_Chr02g266550 [Amborella trichopoda]|uniref:Peroxidase n=1 Tax=Amborella trichopoda TaxID=13333 RepID=W1P2U1_AMBTC|nr:peroxidase 5 [Amborella trichopoda]ERN01974.1 hypothetical protein AMTR_s00045p00065690 [Amborella trichopoda]|eukprot:XP_006840299.1 peroxidase 5 [Amborella trichopoda]
MSPNFRTLCLFLIVVIAPAAVKCDLEIGFYDQTCQGAELLVFDAVARAVNANPGIAAGLIRMFFHDCFVRGCDGSVLIDSTAGNSAEKDSPINNPSLRGFEVIDKAKAAIEAVCPKTVSCADVLAFAARDSTALTGGLNFPVPAGRRDGRISIASETFTNLPPPTFNATQLEQSFARKNLTLEEMVTLSGAHSIGRSHCSSFVRRLYNFSSTNQVDPTLDPGYATFLQSQCPFNASTNNVTVVPMDVFTPNDLDVGYYVGLTQHFGLFTSDQTLLTNSSTRPFVEENIVNPGVWAIRFAKAMIKMGKIEVLTGTTGEIRTNCRVINSAKSIGSVIDTLGHSSSKVAST